MWVRFFEQPWWVRWLINSAFIGAAITVVWYLEITHPLERVDPIVLALGLVGYSVAAGAVSALGQRPAHAAYAEALRGLNPAQLADVGRVLRKGGVPTDPGVLAGATRCSGVAEDYYQRASRGRAGPAISAALLALVGIGSFFLSDTRRGTLWLLLAILLAALTVRREQLRARLKTQLAQLRTAADSVQDITAADLAPPPLPRRSNWQIILFVVVVAAAGIGFAAVADQPRRDCRAADAAISSVSGHSDLMNLQLIVTGGPDLRAYQDWADQLSHFAAEVSAADIAPHVRAIAAHARVAVSLVSQARTRPPPRPIIDLQTAYGQEELAILNEESSLTAACRPR